MPANDLAVFVARLHTMLQNGTLPRGSFRLGPGPGDEITDLYAHAQLLLDEANEYRAMRKAQREQQPWRSMRLALAREFMRLQQALQE